MDHVWNSLREWESVWEERIQYEMNKPEHEYKNQILNSLNAELKAIRNAKKEISKCM